MKYTDYTPNRSAMQIRQDIDMIQSMRPNRKLNKRKTVAELPSWVYTTCHLVAVLGFGVCLTCLLYTIFAH